MLSGKLKSSALIWLVSITLVSIVPALASSESSYEDSIEFFQPFDDSNAEISVAEGLDPTLQGKGTWAYQFTYISKDGTATDLARYRAKEKIKPASLLKLFTGWMAYNKQAQTVDYLHYMLRRSDNARADATLKRMGGTAKLIAYYKKLKFPLTAHNFVMVDGSGLSHSNQLTSELINHLLLHIYLSGKYDAFKVLLAEPQEDGTLLNRFKDLPYPMYGKTGTLADTASLAGFVDLNHGTLIFSVLSNQLKIRVPAARILIDELVMKYIKKAEQSISSLPAYSIASSDI